MWTTTVQPVVIAVMVILEVAVWQVRVALATRGRKRIAAALGAVNAVISVVALGQVVTNLDRPANVVGYAVGVAVGVYLGVVADGRFAGDPVEYRVVLSGDGAASAGGAAGPRLAGDGAARRRAHRPGDSVVRGGRRRSDRRGRARPRAVRARTGSAPAARLRSATLDAAAARVRRDDRRRRPPCGRTRKASGEPRARERGDRPRPARSRRGGSAPRRPGDARRPPPRPGERTSSLARTADT